MGGSTLGGGLGVSQGQVQDEGGEGREKAAGMALVIASAQGRLSLVRSMLEHRVQCAFIFYSVEACIATTAH